MSLLFTWVDPAGAQEAPAAPIVAACLPGSGYAASCDVDQDGDIDIFDIQLTAGHWGQVGIWSSGSWDLTGNAGTTPGTHFLGTTDMEALELRVAGHRALRLEPVASPPDGAPAGGALTPNAIGGHEDNTVTTYVQGAIIGGGGSAGLGHKVFDNFGVIGGGFHNQAGDGAGTLSDRANATVSGGAQNWASGSGATVGGGANNEASGGGAVVGGGSNNTASGYSATVGGGDDNAASGGYASVGGGYDNTASGDYTALAGGYLNQASGDYATVAGGYDNAASGNYSFAAGRRAKANHNGAFVWADSGGTEFASTASGQFLVRAAGGAGINTNAPNAALAVDGGNSVTRIAVNSNSPTANAGLLMRQDGVSRWSIATVFSDGDLTFFREGTGGGIRLFIDGGGANAGYVGIGNNAPQHPLHMASGAYVTTGGVWTNASSRALKVDFATVDRAALLQTLATLPIATWSYRTEESGVRHLGPTAEDFYTAFALGDGGAAIGTVDADGVALAAAQALYQLTQAQQAELAAQQARIERLEARLAALEQELTD